MNGKFSNKMEKWLDIKKMRLKIIWMIIQSYKL